MDFLGSTCNTFNISMYLTQMRFNISPLLCSLKIAMRWYFIASLFSSIYLELVAADLATLLGSSIKNL